MKKRTRYALDIHVAGRRRYSAEISPRVFRWLSTMSQAERDRQLTELARLHLAG